MIKKNNLLLKLLMLFTLGAHSVLAQSTAETPAQSDKKAQEILKSVSSKFKSLQSVKATFTIKLEDAKGQTNETQKGTIQIKGAKYKLDLAGQEVYSDGATRWTYMKESNEVQIDNQRNDENAITPGNVFTMYEKGWLFKFVGEEKAGALTYQLIELIPIDPKKKNIFKVKLKINKADKYIANAKVFEKNGNTQTIIVDQIASNASNAETIFLFNEAKYPGCEKIDLR
ncbi:MAG: hypothetical protein RIQ89_1083 [Bacteroidota bacterium]|jgi:outer membrane lipoprotein carrier protein